MGTIVDNTGAAFIDRGDFVMSFDSASRNGTASITNVGGISASGAVVENIVTGTNATFSGNLDAELNYIIGANPDTFWVSVGMAE